MHQKGSTVSVPQVITSVKVSADVWGVGYHRQIPMSEVGAASPAVRLPVAACRLGWLLGGSERWAGDRNGGMYCVLCALLGSLPL